MEEDGAVVLVEIDGWGIFWSYVALEMGPSFAIEMKDYSFVQLILV